MSLSIKKIIFGCILFFLMKPVFAEDLNTNSFDPYEKYNRVVFKFNDTLDIYVLKPAAEFYLKIVPRPLTKGINHFFNNLDNIPTIANDLLQINFYQATCDIWRFFLNSTLGVLGLFDVATPMGLDANYEDFGLTLAQWGYKQSNYLILPIFGPFTVRDAIGFPINYYAFTVYPYIHPIITRYKVYGLNVISKRAEALRFQSVLQQAAFDRYVFFRNAYLQRRNYQIERNEKLGNPYLSTDVLPQEIQKEEERR